MLNKSKNKQPKKTKQPGNNLAGPEKHVRRQQIVVSAGMRISVRNCGCCACAVNCGTCGWTWTMGNRWYWLPVDCPAAKFTRHKDTTACATWGNIYKI